MRTIAVTAVAIAALTLTACTSGTSNDATGNPTASTSATSVPSGNPADLIGGTFTVTAFTGATGELLGPITLTFDENSWGAGTPCNSHGGDITYSPTQLTTGNIASTAKGCTAELNTQDGDIAQFFSDDPTWRLNGNELTLRTGDQTITAVRD